MNDYNTAGSFCITDRDAGAGGGPADVDPLVAYALDFGVAPLGEAAALSLELDLAGLDAAVRAGRRGDPCRRGR